jgi:hemerythrin-like domain-containing protein
VPVILELRTEHEAAGDLLRQLRQLTNDYTVPDGGCTTWQELYDALTGMEGDLFEHIHLENNILFERHHKLETTTCDPSPGTPRASLEQHGYTIDPALRDGKA